MSADGMGPASGPWATGTGGPPSRVVVLGGAILFGLGLAGAGASSSRYALLLLGLLLGVVGLAAIARYAPLRTCDALLVVLVALVGIPVDAYLRYQDHVGGWPGLRISVADICLYLLAALALLGVALRRVENPIPRRVLLLGAGLVLWYVLSGLQAPRRDLALFEVASTLHGFLLAWIVAALFRRDLLPWVVALVALQVLVHSGFAVAQGVTGRPIGAGWLGGSAEILTEVLEGGQGLLRPAGLMAHPIVYATSLVVWLPLLAATLGAGGSRLVRALSLAALTLGLVGLLLTLSRGAWISAGVAFVTLAVLALRCRLLTAERIRAILLALVLVGAVLGAAFGPRVYDRLTRSDAGNVDVRFDLNEIALRMTLANPFFGAGLNNFTETMAPFDPKDVMDYFPAPVHNLYLLESAEAGVPALLLFLGLFGVILLSALHHLPRMGDPALQWVVAAICAGLVGFLVTQLADFSHRLEPLRSIVWFQIGLLFGVLQENRGQRLARRHEARP